MVEKREHFMKVSLISCAHNRKNLHQINNKERTSIVKSFILCMLSIFFFIGCTGSSFSNSFDSVDKNEIVVQDYIQKDGWTSEITLLQMNNGDEAVRAKKYEKNQQIMNLELKFRCSPKQLNHMI